MPVSAREERIRRTSFRPSGAPSKYKIARSKPQSVSSTITPTCAQRQRLVRGNIRSPFFAMTTEHPCRHVRGFLFCELSTSYFDVGASNCFQFCCRKSLLLLGIRSSRATIISLSAKPVPTLLRASEDSARGDWRSEKGGLIQTKYRKIFDRQ